MREEIGFWSNSNRDVHEYSFLILFHCYHLSPPQNILSLTPTIPRYSKYALFVLEKKTPFDVLYSFVVSPLLLSDAFFLVVHQYSNYTYSKRQASASICFAFSRKIVKNIQERTTTTHQHYIAVVVVVHMSFIMMKR